MSEYIHHTKLTINLCQFKIQLTTYFMVLCYCFGKTIANLRSFSRAHQHTTRSSLIGCEMFNSVSHKGKVILDEKKPVAGVTLHSLVGSFTVITRFVIFCSVAGPTLKHQSPQLSCSSKVTNC